MEGKIEKIFDTRYNPQWIINIFITLILIILTIAFLIPRRYGLIFIIPLGEEIGKSIFTVLLNKRYKRYFYIIAGATGLIIAVIEVLIRGGSQRLIIMGLIIHPLLAMTTIAFYMSGRYTWKAYAMGLFVTTTFHSIINYILSF